MTQPFALEIAANRDRAAQSLQAARELTGTGYHDYAASRAYYAAYYGALALLLNDYRRSAAGCRRPERARDALGAGRAPQPSPDTSLYQAPWCCLAQARVTVPYHMARMVPLVQMAA